MVRILLLLIVLLSFTQSDVKCQGDLCVLKDFDVPKNERVTRYITAERDYIENYYSNSFNKRELVEVFRELFQSASIEAFGKLDTLISVTQMMSSKFEEFENAFKENFQDGRFSEDDESVIKIQSENFFKEANEFHKNSPINKNHGEFIVDLNPILKNDKFAFENEISEGLVRYFDMNLWGFKDKEGSVIIPPKFEESGYFANGLAPVKRNGFWHYINRSDEIMFSIESCEQAFPFYNGFALIKKNNTTFQIIDTTGTAKVNLSQRKLKWSNLEYHLFEKKYGSYWIPELKDYTGQTILCEPQEISEISPVSEGLIYYRTKSDPTYIYYDCIQKKKILYNTTYVEASLFHKGLAIVTDSTGISFIINRYGHAQTPMRKQTIELFSSSRYSVKYGFFPKKTVVLNSDAKCIRGIRGDCRDFYQKKRGVLLLPKF